MTKITPGQTVGLITAISVVRTTKTIPFWQCLCDCGNLLRAWEDQIWSGQVASCGCREPVPTLLAPGPESLALDAPTHALLAELAGPLSKHPLYAVWQNMKRTCYEPRSARYGSVGALGIVVCDQWVDDARAFAGWALVVGWAKGKHLVRKAQHEDYSPTNCEFKTLAERGYLQTPKRLPSSQCRGGVVAEGWSK